MQLPIHLAAVVAALGASAAQAETPSVALPPVNVLGGDGVAIHGADPVAYVVDGRRRDGKADISAQWNGATWRFATTANRDRFVADPERWAPQYGGYCAYGTARGYLVKIDPDAWSVRGGKLYLNYDRAVADTWRQDPDGYIAAADARWPGLAGTAAPE